MTDPIGSEDETPSPDAVPLWRALVRVLTNHVATLEDVKQRIIAVTDLVAARQETPRAAELEELGRAARAEADSATDVARAVEDLGRHGRRRATGP